MAGIASVSRTELAQRRRELRRKRRLQFLQASWRTLAVFALTGGLLWFATLPAWVIRDPNQIQIEGNKFLSTQAIRELLPLSYPQYLLSLNPQTIADRLESQAPISSATAVRQLFPPGLTIQIQERQPVAIARPSPTTDNRASASDAANKNVGLLDESGVWMPLHSYTSVEQSLALPDLAVIGQQELYQEKWPEFYQTLRQSEVKVTVVDWQDPANLIVTTKLGTVHLGSYSGSEKLLAQLAMLEQIRRSSKQLDSQQIDYIDLRNPKSPALQMLKPSGASTAENSSPE